MRTDWWWYGDSNHRPPAARNLSEDDPGYYKDWSGRWVKRTTWTVANYPSATDDWNGFCGYVQETPPARRAQLKAEYLGSQGLVQWWRFPDIWALPGRVKELEARYREGSKWSRETEVRGGRASTICLGWC